MSGENVKKCCVTKLYALCILSLPGLLAVEQTKSALRGRRNSCRVMEPLEADMLVGSGATEAFFWPVGSPFRRSSSTFSASLLSAKKSQKKCKSSFLQLDTTSRSLQMVALKYIRWAVVVVPYCGFITYKKGSLEAAA